MEKGKVAALTQNEIARILLKFSSQGYASGKEPIKEEELLATLRIPLGFITYIEREDEWFYVDAYATKEKDYSWGFTILYYQKRPVFYMSYGGYVSTYLCEHCGIEPKQVTNFLKQALYEQYAQWKKGQEAFLGCRGPYQFASGETITSDNRRLLYKNSPYGGRGIIHTVRGNDQIILFDSTRREESRCLYYHDYLGGLLIEAN